MPPAGFSLGASDLCTYKSKEKAISEHYTIKQTAGYYKMILRIRLIGAVLPPCGQIPVTK